MKKILRGFRREETKRFVAFRSHWNFEASFCTPGEGHEKGGVEGEVGTFRRNHFVPVPAARDLDDLNAILLAGCRDDESRLIDGREQTVGEALAIERQHLLPLAREGFDLVEVSFGQVNGRGCVKVRTNAYSTPLTPGTQAQIKLPAATVEVWYGGRCVARHERSYGRHQHVLDLEHYLDVLEHKPGAFAGSKPLEQWRRAGRWPISYDQFWNGLMQRHGRQGFLTLADELRRTYAQTGSFLEVGVAYVRFAVRQRAYFEVMYRPELYDPNDSAVDAARQQAREVLYGPLAEESDVAPTETRYAGLAAWSLVHGLATLLLTGNLPRDAARDPESLTRSVAGFLFAGRPGQRRS